MIKQELQAIIRRIVFILNVIARLLDDESEKFPEPPTKPPEQAPEEPEKGDKATVTRVIDGDTFEVQYPDGQPEIVRMLGVDTPEVSRRFQDPAEFNLPTTPSGEQWAIRWGNQATEFTTSRLTDATVRLITDPAAGSDPFGRRLAYVRVNGQSFNEELVARGLARVYTGETFEQEDEYLATETEAKRYDRGIWGFDERYRQ